MSSGGHRQLWPTWADVPRLAFRNREMWGAVSQREAKVQESSSLRGLLPVLGLFSLLLTLILSLTLLPARLQATTMIELSLEGMVEASQVIARVRVLDLDVVEGDGQLATLARCEVLEGFKGIEGGSRLSFWSPGGAKGDWLQKVPGAPDLSEGAEAVVFLENLGGGPLHLVGLEQGYLRVFEGPAGPVLKRAPKDRKVPKDREVQKDRKVPEGEREVPKGRGLPEERELPKDREVLQEGQGRFYARSRQGARESLESFRARLKQAVEQR